MKHTNLSSQNLGILAMFIFLALFPHLLSGASTSGAFSVLSISPTDASSCSATDGSFELELDPSDLGVSPYDISVDNGATWLVNNLAPSSNILTASGLQWGTYPIAVRDADGDIIYPGYAEIKGCTYNILLETPKVFSTSSVSGATSYVWTSTLGSIVNGQGTISSTIDFSTESHLATGTVCVQPTGPTCTAPATCFGVLLNSRCYVGTDSDGDGISNECDLDDDNDGIPDLDECPNTSSGLTGPLMTFTADITTTDASDATVPHILDSITYDGVTYSDFILPSSYSYGLTVALPNRVAYRVNDVVAFNYLSNPNFQTDIISAFNSRNLGAYQALDANDYSDGDYYDLLYEEPVVSTEGGFIGVTERNGNNVQIIQALDLSGVALGAPITINPSDYVDLGVVIEALLPQNSHMALYPIDDFAPVGSRIYSLRITFGPTNNSDGPDGKVFIFGDANVLTCDTDLDGIPNHLDLDSDNDGIFDVDEAGHTALDGDHDGVIDGPAADFGTNGLYDGVETFDDSNVIVYTISDSETSPDGIYDAYELDSDDDGCLDAREESVTDSDNDGLAGTGVPVVSTTGLVVANTYAAPANSTWQNPATNNCLSIAGTVFEDINYGGGAGRDFATANTSAQASGWGNLDIGIENVRVELYNSSGAFVDEVATDANGGYVFNNVGPGSYQVRFATRTAVSNRGSNSTGATAYAVPTFRSVGATAITNQVGGTDPVKEDAPANLTSQNISALTTASLVAQATSSVTLVSSGATNVDLGLSFNVVTNKNSSGIGSVRQFIINANELDNTNIDLEDSPSGRPSLVKPAGVDVSVFEITGVGPHTVVLSTVLPDLEDPFTHLSGYTQQGSVQGLPEARTIVIGLDGTPGGFDGLRLDASNLSVSGLALHDFGRGITTLRSGATNTHVWGNYVGLETDGLTAGTNTSTGVYIYLQASATVGTNGDGVNDLNEGNVLSNSYEGLNLRGSSNVLVAGNYVGLDRTGLAPEANRYHGIFVRDCPNKNIIGLDDNNTTLTATTARNVVSGNNTDGIRLFGSSNQVIAGNYIGTGRLGLSPFANGGYGIQLISAVSSNQIGTDSDNLRDVEERNIISGNGAGIRFIVGSTGADNWVAGNYIGVDVTGNAVLPNNTTGVVAVGSQTNTIIGTNGDGVRDAIEGNVISGNRDDGIRIDGTVGILVAGNHIGVGADESVTIPNEGRGILIATTSGNNTVGYSTSMVNTNPAEVGNIIRGNGDTGIAASGTGLNNRFSRNNYGANGALAIDLDYDLVTINDNGDGDAGPNNLLNYPVFSYSKQNTSTLRVQGFAPAGSTIELYIADGGVNPSPLPSGYTNSFGEGFQYLTDVVEGSAQDNDATTGSYTDDGSGASSTKTQQKFSFDVPLASLPISLTPGTELTAIAIDAAGNTSEFSGRQTVRFVEICDDLIDNDGDGFIDCADQDCPDANPVSTVAN